MERRKIIKKLLIHFILIHVAYSVIHLLSYRLGHPIFKYLKNYPLGVQIGGLLVLDFLSFVLAGWIYANLYKERKKLNIVIAWPSVILFLILLSVYAFVYYFSITFFNRNIMIFYVIMNPWYGTYMIKLSDAQLYSLWWMLSSVMPPLGYYVGVKLNIKMKGTDS